MSETEKSLREMLRHNAQEVDLLRDEIERLRAALKDVHAAAGTNHMVATIARAALEGK